MIALTERGLSLKKHYSQSVMFNMHRNVPRLLISEHEMGSDAVETVGLEL